jgi:transposase
LGYNMSLWTTKLVQHFLYTRLGIEYCREHPRQLLHELGVRRRRLRHRHLKAKPEAQAAFRAGLEVLLEDWPEEWELVFVDEATVRRQPTLTAQWCLVEAVPEVPMGDVYAKGPVDGAVAPLPGQTHYYISPELGKGEFAQFLQHLLVYHPGKRLLVIHDRGGQHKGTPVDAVVREAQGRLVLKPQPAYSPELNPQERIWKWLRRVVTHNHWFATLTAQIEAIRNFFRYLAGVKAQVRRLCSLKTPESYLENSLGRGGRAWFELHLIAQILEASRQPVHQLVALPLIEVVGP